MQLIAGPKAAFAAELINIIDTLFELLKSGAPIRRHLLCEERGTNPAH